MTSLIGNKIEIYCPGIIIGPYAKMRLCELNKLKKDKTYHEERWKNRIKKADIIEAQENLVIAKESNVGTYTAYLVDLATCEVLTVFLYKQSLQYLNLGTRLVL